MSHSLAIAYTTVATMEEAKSIARKAVEEKIVFCANIIPHGLSIYRWQGEVHESFECFILFKTSREMQLSLKEWLIKNHPYATPIIIQGNVSINQSYLQSMCEELNPSNTDS